MWSTTYRELMKEHYNLSIGRYSYGPCLFPGLLPSGTAVGNYCSFAAGVQVYRRNHPMRRCSQHPFFYNRECGFLNEDTIPAVMDSPLTIGHDVWLGANTIITPRCKRIGIGAIVGAGSVVTHNVPDFAIVAGNPAHIVRRRFNDDVCSALLESKWWDYSIREILPLLQYFIEDISLEHAQCLRDRLKMIPNRTSKAY